MQLGLDSQYIGDGYPFCSDLPDHHFLKTGATYLLRGADPNPELLNDPDSWAEASPKRLSLDFATSALASKLCNGSGSSCNPAAKVVLDSDLVCTGTECEINEPRTLEVAPGLWFEYVRSVTVMVGNTTHAAIRSTVMLLLFVAPTIAPRTLVGEMKSTEESVSP